ncbi:uncharacterized protein LOC124168773 [Ischnura elegans]|uniref:uncharacterized protein LOC124168773 n=1 Tax=Ischnura elegans TaxID=197161 RepID=UPI001ED86B1A|nr:uncharacterized protein LOC124168773 [Ischnura elegans]
MFEMDEWEYLDPGAAKGLCNIAVMETVHGGKYWVSEPPGIHMSKEREAVVLLETRLAEIMFRTFEIAKDIPENKLIAVKNEATGCWHRGKLLSPMPDSSTTKARVFLVDHGEFLGNVKINHLQPLPEDMQDLDPQAFVVCLYGLIPLTVDVQLQDINDKFHFERNAIWTTASEIYAQKMLEMSSSAYLSGIRVEGRTVHGEIFLNVKGRGLVSLNKELCRRKYAYFCEEAYEKVIIHEINVERRMKQNEEALIEAARLESDKAQMKRENLTNLKHILMEDFMKEYVCKKLLRQEKVADTLKKMHQDVDMKGLQATDEATRKLLEAEILSSASRPLGRASSLRKEGEPVDVSPPKGRGLPLATTGRERTPSGPGSRAAKNGHGSLLTLLDSVSCKREESMADTDFSEGGPLNMIPAGYPIVINEPSQKKKNNNGKKGSPCVEQRVVFNSDAPQKDDEGVKMSSARRPTVSPQSNSSSSRNRSLICGINNNVKMRDDFVQMCRLYGECGTAGARERCEEDEGKVASPVGSRKMTLNTEGKSSPEAAVAKVAGFSTTSESGLKDLITSRSKSDFSPGKVEMQTNSKEEASPEVMPSHVAKDCIQSAIPESRLRRLMQPKGTVASNNVEIKSHSEERASPEANATKDHNQSMKSESRLRSLMRPKGIVASNNVEIKSHSEKKASPEANVTKDHNQSMKSESILRSLKLSRSKATVTTRNVEMKTISEEKASLEANATQDPTPEVMKSQNGLGNFMSHSKVAPEKSEMQTETAVPISEHMDFHPVMTTMSGAERMHRIASLRQKSGGSNASSNETISFKGSNMCETENLASKSRKEKTINPLFSLLEMIKKKKNVGKTCDERTHIGCDQTDVVVSGGNGPWQTTSIPFDPKDSDVSKDNESSKTASTIGDQEDIDVSLEKKAPKEQINEGEGIKFPSSQSVNDVQVIRLSPSVNDIARLSSKRLTEYPLINQAFSIPSPTSEAEIGKERGFRAASQKKCSISIFAAGEWKNSNLNCEEKCETQLNESSSSVEVDDKPKTKLPASLVEENVNSSDVSSDLLACTESRTRPPKSSERLEPKTVIDNGVDLESSGVNECEVDLGKTEVEVSKSVPLASLHELDKDELCQSSKVANENEVSSSVLSHSSSGHLKLNELKRKEYTKGSDRSDHCSSSKPGFSSSMERFFKVFHTKKQNPASTIEGGSPEDGTEEKPKNVLVSLECTSRVSGELDFHSSEEKSSGRKWMGCASAEETACKQVISVDGEVFDLEDSNPRKGDDKALKEFSRMKAKEDFDTESANFMRAQESPVKKGLMQPSQTTESSDKVPIVDQACFSDESISREIREVHSLAKSLSKIEAEKNSKIFDAIKSKGVSLQNISVRLPLVAAQENVGLCTNSSLPKTPILSDETSRGKMSTAVGKMEEVEKQKILEPEAVKPSWVGRAGLPHLLHCSWMPDVLGGDCLLTAHRVKMSRVLVRGHLLAQPIQSIAQAPFKGVLHEALSKMRYRDPMRIQTYAWPALMRGHNLIMVNPPRSGKTLGYLLPLISFMLSPDLYNEVPKGNGPMVLILCPSWNVVAQINDYCMWLLENVHMPARVIPVYGGMEDEQTIPLINGCEILITTPRCFLRIIAKSRIITNFDRLCHLVFDETDTMMKKFLPEVKEILRECQLLLKKRARLAAESNPSGDSDLYQVVKFVAASKTWCPQMESFVTNIIEKPLLCIGSYLEAAVFAQLKPTLHIVGYQDCVSLTPSKSNCDIEEVDNVILGILKKSLGFEKFVVACESVEDVQRLAPKIIELGANLLVVHERQLHFDIAETRQTWLGSQLSGALPVLLISDGPLAEFNIGNADHLVHVGVPCDSKTKFGLRFSTLMDNYRDIFSKDNKKSNCSVDIVVDINQPDLEIFGLIEFLQRLGMSIPPELEALASKSLLRKEMMKKKDLLLCPKVKSFGECDKSACKFRHAVLPDVDQPMEGLPKNGAVRIKVLNVFNASRISARLLEHISPDGTKTLYPNEYFHIAAGLARHFRNPENVTLHGTPAVGDMCAIESEHNLYQRAQVTAIVQRNLDSQNPTAVSVNLVDDGTTKTVKAYQLHHLPDEFKRYPPQAKELIICCMLPRDLDTSWSKAASVKVAELLEEASDGELDGKEIIGEVVLALGGTIWVDPLECREWLEKMKTSIIHMSIRRDLLALGLAIDNPDHINKLIKLCDAAGLSLPEKIDAPESPEPMLNELCDEPSLSNIETNPDDSSKEIIWESLHFDKLIDVNVIAVDTPSCFKAQKVSLSDELLRLSEDIQFWLTKAQENPENGTRKEYAIGSICIAFCSADDSWCRAKVLSPPMSIKTAVNRGNSEVSDGEMDVGSEEEIHYDVYFVDYGDTAFVSINRMVPITESLMQLPFQAIECSLVGVRPVARDSEDSSDGSNDKWDEDASDAFFNLCRDKDDVDIYKPLLAKVFGIEGKGTHGGLKHLVVLYDKYDEEVKKIGTALVEQGFAVACQVIVDGEPEEDVSLELESHWVGEKALLPFTAALRDDGSAPSLQSGEPLDPGGERKSNADGECDDDDGSDSFEIVMTDEEVKMCEEKLRRFLGIPPRRVMDGAKSAGNDLKPIAYNEASVDDHSSLCSYEVISTSPTQSVGKFEELTVEEAERLAESRSSSQNVGDAVDEGESVDREVESERGEKLPEGIKSNEVESELPSSHAIGVKEGDDSGGGRMECLPSNSVSERENLQKMTNSSECTDEEQSGESCLEVVSKENEKCTVGDADEKIEDMHIVIDAAVESADQNSEEKSTMECESCIGDNNSNPCTHHTQPDSHSVRGEHILKEIVNEGDHESSSMSADGKAEKGHVGVDVTMKSGDQNWEKKSAVECDSCISGNNCNPSTHLSQPDSNSVREELIFDESWNKEGSKSSSNSESDPMTPKSEYHPHECKVETEGPKENENESKECCADEGEATIPSKGKEAKDQNGARVATVSLCSSAENVDERVPSPTNCILSKQVASCTPALGRQLDFSPVFATEVCYGYNAEDVSLESKNEMDPVASVFVVLQESDSSQLPPKLATDDDLSKEDLAKADEIMEPDNASEEAAIKNQDFKDIVIKGDFSKEDPTKTDIIIVPESANGGAVVSDQDSKDLSEMKDRLGSTINDVHDSDMRKGKSLRMDETSESVCDSQEEPRSCSVSKDISKPESVVASNEIDTSPYPLKPGEDSDCENGVSSSKDKTYPSICVILEKSSGSEISKEDSEYNLNSKFAVASNGSDKNCDPLKSVHGGDFKERESLSIEKTSAIVCVDSSGTSVSMDTSASTVCKQEVAEASSGSEAGPPCPSKVVDGIISEGELSNMDETSKPAHGSQEEIPGHGLSQCLSEMSLNSETLLKSAQDNHASKDDTLSVSECAEVSSLDGSRKESLSPVYPKNVNIKIDLMACQHSNESNDMSVPSAENLLDQSEVVCEEKFAKTDAPECSGEQGSDTNLEGDCEADPFDGMPPLVRAKIPQVKWIQNKWEVAITVELPEMKKYSIHWKTNKLLYLHASSGRSDGKNFALELPLWASINTEECVHMPVSNSTVKFVLPKGFTSVDWPRLLSSPTKPLWLSVDFDKLVDDGDEETDERTFEVITYRSSDDESNSEDEGPERGVRCEEVNYDPYDPLP